MIRDELIRVIVDDDPAVVFLHKIMLAENGVGKDYLIFHNGREALEYFLTADPTGKYLVFLDINMPVMDGWDLMKQIESRMPQRQIYVVMVTSSIDEKDRARSKTYKRIVGYVEKPLNRTALNSLYQLKEFKVCMK